MNDENERSVASAGSVAGGNDLIDRLSELSGDVGRWGGKTICEAIDEIERLRLAIRQLADQDATLSVVGGNVIVEMDATLTLTDTERVAVEIAADACGNCNGFGGDTRRPALYEGDRIAATLRGLLERTK